MNAMTFEIRVGEDHLVHLPNELPAGGHWFGSGSNSLTAMRWQTAISHAPKLAVWRWRRAKLISRMAANY